MRNCLFMGEATRFLKEEAGSVAFFEATRGSISPRLMRDREFVNRFCAFEILGVDEYKEMDGFLAEALKK